MSEAQPDQPPSNAPPTDPVPVAVPTSIDVPADTQPSSIPPLPAISTDLEQPAESTTTITTTTTATTNPVPASAPDVGLAAAPALPTTLENGSSAASVSAPTPAPVSTPMPTPTPTPGPPPPVATSAAIASPSIAAPPPPPPPSMPPYHSTPAVSPANPPPMHPQPPMGSAPPSTVPPMQPMGQYNPAYSPAMAQMGMQGGQMSYQLSGNRSRAHQREVKRRTKTGCLTCRKRRIKCDEGHPVCRNCVKSKRECLGYDPVFRQQPGQSDLPPTASSQPSLVVNPQENHNSNPNPNHNPNPNPNPYPSAPIGYIPASAQPFAPSSVQSDSSVQSFDQHNNNNIRQGPVEPSIEGSDTMSMMASVQDTIDGSISQPVGTPDLSTPALMPLSGQVGRQDKVKIQDLLALQGIAPPPPYPIVPIQQARLDQIQTVYLHTYAPAIDRFLETRWFRDKGLSQLLTNAQLMAQYSALIDAFNDPKLEDPAVRGRVESFEASVVWDTMSICRSARNLVRNGNTEPMQEYDLLTTANRFDILEALITDDHIKDNPLRADLTREPPPNPNSLQDQLRMRSLNFWNCIGHFLTLHDNEASSAVEIDDTLGRCRALLDQIENRDVIYSMAIGRHLGQRLSDFHPRNRPDNSSDERNANTKLLVAQRFIEDEAKEKGTTQVVKRLCGMVHRLWELKNILLPRA